MLNQERIERVAGRSQAEYKPDGLTGQAMVLVTRKMGKWNQFGYVQDGLLYLHFHEALHLIEMVIICKHTNINVFNLVFIQLGRIVSNYTLIQLSCR